jgi:xylan 1,4-beta-xylosidase
MILQDKVKIEVNAGIVVRELKHSWKYIGYDECNYTHTPEGEELIAKFGKLDDAPYYIRAHHMLCTGNCHGTYKWGSTNAYVEDEMGNPIYNWTVIDEILDIYLKNNCKPFFEIGFMPMDLVDEKYVPEVIYWKAYGEYQRNGWACPPKDYRKWYDLVLNLVKHCVEKYGEEEVLTWYWELWNEPDIFYWQGTVEEFCKLYDYTEAAVHAVLKEARLGGPSTTSPTQGSESYLFLDKFLNHCKNGTNYVTGEKGTRLDYITFHVKGGGFPFKVNAVKATPSTKSFVQQVKTGCEVIQKYGYEDLEVVLTEADPDGWAAGGIYDNANMNFRNTEYYATYVASAYNNLWKVASEMNMDVRPLAWAFMFVGERCFEGTRTFSTQGINKAVFNLFRMYSKMGNKRISLQSSQARDELAYKDDFATGEEPEVSGMASICENGEIVVMVYSHHDDWDLERDFDVDVDINNCFLGDEVVINHYRIDKTHSNAYAEWIKQGRPKYPSEAQYAAIKERDGLELFETEKIVRADNGNVKINFKLPAHAVSLIVLSKN